MPWNKVLALSKLETTTIWMIEKPKKENSTKNLLYQERRFPPIDGIKGTKIFKCPRKYFNASKHRSLHFHFHR
jgi:hypothetical protein